jgi:hypothetical protein
VVYVASTFQLFLTPSLDEGERSTSCAGLLGPWLPFSRRLGGPQSQFGYFGEENYLLLLPGIELQFLSFPVLIIEAVATACGGGGGCNSHCSRSSSSSHDSLHFHSCI